MKKILIATLAAIALLGFAGSSFALLCASDQVPAGTLLFPFVTARYDELQATKTNPVVDYTSPVSLFAITNVSSSARIVHNVLWNDMSFPLLDWDVLLTGYDVITFNFGRILEGYLVATGPATNPDTSRPYSPTGGIPAAQGPVPTHVGGILALPSPQGVGTTANNTASIFGLCTNPAYTVPYPINTGNQANRIPAYNMGLIYDGMRMSQQMAESKWWSQTPTTSGGFFSETPSWLLNRKLTENVWGYITSDVVDACGLGFPGTLATYFTDYARPRTWSAYANGFNAATFRVNMGNTLIGDWFIIDTTTGAANAGPAVHIEMDNQDIDQTTYLGGGCFDTLGVAIPCYGQYVFNGLSFYRYSSPLCYPTGVGVDFSAIQCATSKEDYVSAADYDSGGFYNNAVPSNDYRESLPSAFAFRWITDSTGSSGFGGGTSMRVWKEFPDLEPEGGITYVNSDMQYGYYAWDEEERVLVAGGGCDVSPCGSQPAEINELPLETQEVDVDVLLLPTTNMGFGWVLLAFLGSNQYTDLVPGGYTSPTPFIWGTQAWVSVLYEAGSGRYNVDLNAAVLGNFLCDGLSVRTNASSMPAPVRGATDLGDILY